MQKSNSKKRIVKFTLIYILAAAFSFLLNHLADKHLQVGAEKIIESSLFLGGVYLLFYFLFIFTQKIIPEQIAPIFLVMLLLKSGIVIAFLFIFLNPMDEENKKETLLFFKTYFVLLVTDLAIKVQLMKQ